MPYHNIFILGVFVRGGGDEGFDASTSAGLVGEFTAGVEFAIFVFSEPDSMVGEFSTTGMEGRGIG